MEKCGFCTPLKRLLALETPHFFVLYDPYPLVEGHLMIATRLHYGCGGEFSKEMMKEFLSIKSEVMKLLKGVYSRCICYEHGRAGACMSSGLASRICHHMHFHIVPFAEDLEMDIQETLLKKISTSYSQIPRLFNSEGDYIYYENPEGQGSMFPAGDTKAPSHFLRTLISIRNKTKKRANWESYPENALFHTCMKKIPPKKFAAFLGVEKVKSA